MKQETPLCGNPCGFGCEGFMICCIGIPLGANLPLGGLILCGCCGLHLRRRVITHYNVEEPNRCCCGPCNETCNDLDTICNLPCNLWQMSVSIREWEEESKKSSSRYTTPISPVNYST